SCAARAHTSFEVRSIDRRRAGEFDAGLIDLAEQTAKSLGQTVLRLDTIGGHDAVSMSAVTPAIVIGVPSVGGVIHHPTEFTTPEDRLLGTELLAGMLWR
ncbi:MAG: M20/M25/M40 family metallo-hydrolase, partial [Mesorhizobium sp.]